MAVRRDAEPPHGRTEPSLLFPWSVRSKWARHAIWYVVAGTCPCLGGEGAFMRPSCDSFRCSSRWHCQLRLQRRRGSHERHGHAIQTSATATSYRSPARDSHRVTPSASVRGCERRARVQATAIEVRHARSCGRQGNFSARRRCAVSSSYLHKTRTVDSRERCGCVRARCCGQRQHRRYRGVCARCTSRPRHR